MAFCVRVTKLLDSAFRKLSKSREIRRVPVGKLRLEYALKKYTLNETTWVDNICHEVVMLRQSVTEVFENNTSAAFYTHFGRIQLHLSDRLETATVAMSYPAFSRSRLFRKYSINQDRDAQASLEYPDGCLCRDGRPSTPVLCNAKQ